MHKRYSSGAVNIWLILTICFSVFFVGATIFAVWAFMGRNDLRDNMDSRIEAAVVVAKQETSTAKEKEFREKEKYPTKKFEGPNTYGGVTLDYPKTWSVVTNSGSSAPLDATFHPNVVPNGGSDIKFSYAVRLQVLNQPYEKAVVELNNLVKNGAVKATPYRLKKLPDILGTRFDGQYVNGKTGIVIMVPLRDKTLKIWTESLEYKDDFEKIILETLSFQP